MNNTDFDISRLPEVRGEYKFNEPLSRYTWLNVGGPADVLFFPQDEDDLCRFLQNRAADIPLFVLGGGSNLLIRDGGISGVVIKLKNESFSRWQIENELLYVGAGRQNFRLKEIIEPQGLGGLEFLCSIPGSIGGLFKTNAGCFGSELADILASARVIDYSGKIFNVPFHDFHFSYRHSDFPDDLIILGAYFKYTKSDTQTVHEKIVQNAEYRKTHQPQNVRTAGSTFKNPEGYKAWQLIKDAQADTLQIGGAKLSAMHCNFLINDGSATASDIENLIHAVQQKVKEHSGIDLVSEINIIGRQQP